jgi:hypothetical protein
LYYHNLIGEERGSIDEKCSTKARKDPIQDHPVYLDPVGDLHHLAREGYLGLDAFSGG